MITDEVAADVEQFADPALAVEFADTLSRTWAEDRDAIRSGTLDPTLLYKLLDSFASVVLKDFEV